MNNTKTTKRALLSSVTAMLICVAMLIGTTFAWFTDKVTSSGNIIKSGRLDISATFQNTDANGTISYDVPGFTRTADNKIKFGDAKTDINENNKIIDEQLWEPGAVGAKLITVNNDGNLAAKIMLNFNVNDGGLQNALWYDFIMVNGNNVVGTFTEREMSTLTTYARTVQLPLMPKDENCHSVSFILVYGMKEEAGNEYQDKSFSADVTIFATQYTHESDSFDDQYDTNATYLNTDAQGNNYFISNANELVYFAKSVNVDGETYAGKTVKLTADIDLAGKLWIPVGQTQVSSFQGTFDGQGHIIKNMTVNYTGTNSNYACGLFGWIELHNSAPIVIQNVKFDNANVTGIKYTGVVAGYANGASGAEIKNCVVTNSTVTSNSKNAGGIIGYMGKGVLTGNTVSGCTISAKYDVGGIANSVEPAVTFQNNKVENTKIYYEEDQSYDAAGIFTGGKVVYRDDNNKTTFVPDSTNTNSNVTVNKLVAVSTASELSAALNKTYTEDTTVMLTKDITLTGEWGEHSLNGSNNAKLVIDGNHKTIYGLNSSEYHNLGGFDSNGLVTNIGAGFSSVTFKNLTIDGATLTNNGGDSAATGVFVGDINTVNVTFDTCTVKGANVNCYKWAGGFIGYIQDVNTTKKTVTFKNCVVSDSNINTTDSSVGGLVGHNYTDLTITGCQIKGNTTIKCAEDRTGKEAKAGYLIGTVNGGSASISNITVDSTVNLDTMGGTTYDTTKYVGRN